jgi:hypothetical protein
MELRVMVAPGFGDADRLAIEETFVGKVGDELKVEVKVVEDIPLTGRGKLRRLIQEIFDPSPTSAPNELPMGITGTAIKVRQKS